MAAIGVHFGYTCACVAIFKDGRADVIANDAGDRVTPSVVAYRDTEQIVGIAAKQGRVRNAANTVVKVKQLLGRTAGDPETDAHKAESKCPGEKLYYESPPGRQSKLVTPDAVAKLVPRKDEREAAEAAGFNVLRLIHEPSAALLAYNIGQEFPSGKSHVLVYKLGGTSLSVTALQVNGGMFRVLDTLTDHSIGGESITGALAQHLAAEFKRSFKQDVSNNARAMMKLMNGADLAKHSLSSLGSANCFVDSLHDGMDFDCNISRCPPTSLLQLLRVLFFLGPFFRVYALLSPTLFSLNSCQNGKTMASS
ncbi:Heat shock protein 14 [Merluccius polli]|uniref:Heat shock protein 14 n=1 Tax=Merluccius polli TaxID=89951 RepID=A0AA47MJX7_MERPO|nr:Heat shock protein 14 [Merluccius polli]